MAIDSRTNDSRNGNWTLDWKRRYNWKRQRQEAPGSFVFVKFSSTIGDPYYRSVEILIEASATSKVIRHSHSLVRPINFIAARGYHGDGSGRRGGK